MLKKWDKRVILNILKNPIYVGKLRWNEDTYDGKHDAIVQDSVFEQVQQILSQRAQDMKERQWHNGDERLLSGTVRCARCKSHMFGGGGRKNGQHILYYVCSKRFTHHDCDQDYVRAELLESAIIQDIKSIFRHEQFMAHIWEEANRRLAADKPELDKEIVQVEEQMADVRQRIDRYFEAFETGALKAELCGEKVEGLKTRLDQLTEERQTLEARRERLELPAIDREMLAGLLDRFENVFAAGTNPPKKHLLRLLVKKVLIHDRRTVEVWYCLPNRPRFENREVGLPECASLRTANDLLPKNWTVQN